MKRSGVLRLAALPAMAVSLALTLEAGGAARAQTQAQFDRIDELARYTVISAFCPQLGFTVDSGGETFARAFAAETQATGLDPAVAQRLYADATERRQRTFEVDLETEAEQATAIPNFSKLKQLFLTYGEQCQHAAADSIFSQIVTAPPGFQLERAATEAADKLLAPGGFASWQTPQIQARGDILTIAGACRRHFGAARSDALLKAYGATEDPRERAYYAKAFETGLSDPEFNQFDATQCERALRSLEAKAR